MSDYVLFHDMDNSAGINVAVLIPYGHVHWTGWQTELQNLTEKSFVSLCQTVGRTTSVRPVDEAAAAAVVEVMWNVCGFNVVARFRVYNNGDLSQVDFVKPINVALNCIRLEHFKSVQFHNLVVAESQRIEAEHDIGLRQPLSA